MCGLLINDHNTWESTKPYWFHHRVRTNLEPCFRRRSATSSLLARQVRWKSDNDTFTHACPTLKTEVEAALLKVRVSCTNGNPPSCISSVRVILSIGSWSLFQVKRDPITRCKMWSLQWRTNMLLTGCGRRRWVECWETDLWLQCQLLLGWGSALFPTANQKGQPVQN